MKDFGYLIEHLRIVDSIRLLMRDNHEIEIDIDKRTWTMIGVWKGPSDANLLMYYGYDDYILKTSSHTGLERPIERIFFQIHNTNIFLRQLIVY